MSIAWSQVKLKSEPISWTLVNRVLANFDKNSTNFVAMAMRVNRGGLTKIIHLLHPQNPLLDARISEIFRTYVEL